MLLKLNSMESDIEMKKQSKFIMCFLLIVAMVMQLVTVSFAAVSTTTIGAVSYTYDAETKTYTASVSARGLEKEAMLIVAEYDKDTQVVKTADISRTAENAKEGLLTAELTVSDEANEVRAFVWSEDYAPFNLDTALGNEYTADDIEIYFDDVDFAATIGEEMELDAEYDYVLPLTNDNFRIPKITFDLKDSTIDADIVTDAEAMQTVITFEAGARIKTAVLDTHVADAAAGTYYKATRYEYSKPWVHTVTINYVLPESGYIGNHMLAARSNVNGLQGGYSKATYDYVMEYQLAEDKEYDTISFKADSFTNQFTIIVVEPLEAATKGTDAIVKADGSPVTWTIDGGTIMDYDYTLSGADRINEPWDASRATFAEMSSDTSVVVKGASSDGGDQVTFQTCTSTNANGHYRVMRKLQDSDGYFVSGSRISEGQRDPSWQKIQYTNVPDSLLGYNYITNHGTAQYDMTVSMTVNQDVKLHFISTGTSNGVTTLKPDGTDNQTISATNLGNDCYVREYQNTAIYDSLSVANAIVNHGMDESIFLRTNNYTYNATVGDVKYSYVNDVYVVRNWAQARVLFNNANSGKYILPEYLEKIGMDTTTSGTTVTVAKKTVAEYVNLWKSIEGIEPLISTPEIVTGHVYNGSNVTYASSLHPVIRAFNGADTNRSIFSDRNGAEQARHTGMIVSYPEAFDLEDSIFITTGVKYGDGGEGDRTMYRMYGNIDKLEDYEPYPLYTFKVARECEVLIFSNGYSHAYLDNAENGWTSSTISEPLSYVHVSNAVAEDAAENKGVVSLYKVYRKTFLPGDTVTMYTPGNTLTVFIPFIKELNVEHNADAQSITLDGVALEGFSKDVYTYTYSLNDVARTSLPEVEVTPADPTTEVEVIYNKSYEAPSAKVVLTSLDRKKTTYTINFTNSEGEVTNIYLLSEGNVIPMEYIDGATADYTAGNNMLPKYEKKGFGLDKIVWADRTNYKVTVVNDEILEGKDVIRSNVGWWNTSDKVCVAYKYLNTNDICVPWVNFKTTRGATVMVLKTTNAHNTWFADYGFTETSDNNGFFHMVRDSNNVNKSNYKYSKDVKAGELVSVPNDWESSNSYTIIIKYADYK